MKQNVNKGQAMPTANLAINKSRLKVYNNNKSKYATTPTYYLEKGQESNNFYLGLNNSI